MNDPLVAERCGDKYVTNQILVNAGLPTPSILMAFSEEAALAACDHLGYPCVLKTGYWVMGAAAGKSERPVFRPKLLSNIKRFWEE